MDIREFMKSQYRASLDMLGDAVAKCPDTLWTDASYENRFWHVAYHTLYFAHLYLQENLEAFVPWSKARAEYQFMGTVPWPPHNKPNIGEPYTKDEIVEYLDFCRAEVEEKVATVDLEAASGFFWLPFRKSELQVYNIRHIQHHVGQLADRLRTKEAVGVAWIGLRPECSADTP